MAVLKRSVDLELRGQESQAADEDIPHLAVSSLESQSGAKSSRSWQRLEAKSNGAREPTERIL